uniref:Splicing factor 3B subunit 1-like n=1 Tax=Tanacetum cinerariifolium TaxID=118510 RepID=A0A6L2LNJ1_TANCI|nr:splicing factor 3B subunit 1-like [Tanacetum cinerariifolium]
MIHDMEIVALEGSQKRNSQADVNTFGYIAKAMGPQDVLATLLNNLKNGVLKSLSFLFEYVGEMGKDYIYAVTPLLEDALMDQDLVHRQTVASVVKHMALGVAGLGCEEVLVHLLNYIWPNIFKTSLHVIIAVMEAIEGMRLAIWVQLLCLTTVYMVCFILQGRSGKCTGKGFSRTISTYFLKCFILAYPVLEDGVDNVYTRRTHCSFKGVMANQLSKRPRLFDLHPQLLFKIPSYSLLTTPPSDLNDQNHDNQFIPSHAIVFSISMWTLRLSQDDADVYELTVGASGKSDAGDKTKKKGKVKECDKAPIVIKKDNPKVKPVVVKENPDDVTSKVFKGKELDVLKYKRKIETESNALDNPNESDKRPVFLELHQKFVEVFKNPIEFGYYEHSDGIDHEDDDGDDDDDGGNGYHYPHLDDVECFSLKEKQMAFVPKVLMDLSDIEVPRVFVTCRNMDDWTENCILLHFMLGQQLELTVSGLKFGVENSTDYNKAKDPIPFRRRVFSSNLDERPIRGEDVLLLIESDVFKRLEDNDTVSLCCVGILQLVLFGVEDRRHVPNWILRLANDIVSWDNYPWGSYVWPTLYKHLRDAKPANETDNKSYPIEGFAWAFKTWILESFRATTNDYYTCYRRHPRIVAWSSKHKFYRNMLKPMMHGQLPVQRLVPDETEARS